MEECIFCKIVQGKIPASTVYEDDKVLAFDDIRPAAPVHVIIIPKKHIPTLMDVTSGQDEDLAAAMHAILKIARIKGIDERGFKTVINCGEEGGQVISHLHIHVLGGEKMGSKPV
jgi:histidine triad (HIT) family protein